ncbi:hypothetical protein TEU_07230 [Thermococcus eurythermalis]|uniref:CGP-CTERM sorting domain-containing protein n=1 Tax=Thermococcus eurythermalis TaxID=1505907 RepID=A0A097QUI4_9EURY|nr:hypothetical protein [Thermococcus eurythermalis]AIU70139.1 hypothetical protein TEU_07230 [Thermococcus eurythermalis]
MLRRAFPPALAILLFAGLVAGSAVIVTPPEGMVTYPEVVAGVGSDGNGGFVVVVPFNMTANGTPVVPGAWIGSFYPNGSLKWGENVKGAPLYPSPRVLKAAANGSIVLVGQSNRGNHTDIWVIKLDKKGKVLWSKDYLLDVGQGWIPFIDSVAIERDEILIATHVDSFIEGRHVSVPLVLALNADGEILWAREYRVSHLRELYSTAVGKTGSGYYLIVHTMEDWYYIRLNKDGQPLENWQIKSSLRKFFIKSARSFGETVYLLGGSSNGTVMGAILGNKTLWAKSYTLIPERICTETGENATAVSSSSFSTEPAPILTASEGHIIFQLPITESFKLECDGGVNTTYAVIKTDKKGNVVEIFAMVSSKDDFDGLIEPLGISTEDDDFIALWRKDISSGTFLKFQGLGIVSHFDAEPIGPNLRPIDVKVKAAPADFELVPGPEVVSTSISIKIVESPVKVEETKEAPVAVIALEDKPSEGICGLGILLILSLPVLLLRRR